MNNDPIVQQLPNNDWAVYTVLTVHPTKGAADKAANKLKTQSSLSDPYADDMNARVERARHAGEMAARGVRAAFTNTPLFRGNSCVENVEKHSTPENSKDIESQDFPSYLEVHWKGTTYTFDFFTNKVGMYVAVCRVPRSDQTIDEFFGMSDSWWSAAQECLNKILECKKG